MCVLSLLFIVFLQSAFLQYNIILAFMSLPPLICSYTPATQYDNMQHTNLYESQFKLL